MFLTRPTASRRVGFTLVELLTVVAIISLLIGILLPSLSRARDQAKRAKVAGLLSAIDKGLEMFHNDFSQYPDSQLRPDPIDWNGSVQGLANNKTLSGAHWLARAMAGHDTKGVDAQGLGLGNVALAIKAKDMEPGSTVNIDRKGPYQEGEIYFRDDDLLKFPGGGGPGDIAGTGTTGRLLIVEDSFNSPVIYYRSNERAKNPFCYDGVTDTPGVYRQADNALITGSDQDNTPKGWDFAGVGALPNSASGDPIHPLGNLGRLQGAAPNLTIDPTDSFMGVLHSQSALKSSATLKPVSPDRFLLITAGKDGRFGTRDDVSNFKSGL